LRRPLQRTAVCLRPWTSTGRKLHGKKKRKPGGQPGHEGNTLQPVDHPDEIKELKIDRKILPGGKWKDAGYKRRQVFDLVIRRHVTEYHAERLENERDEYITAEFPEGVVQAAQYGNSVKAHAVYMSIEQLVPRKSVSEHFAGQMNLPLSAGSVCNFKKEAYERLESFEEWVISRRIEKLTNDYRPGKAGNTATEFTDTNFKLKQHGRTKPAKNPAMPGPFCGSRGFVLENVKTGGPWRSAETPLIPPPLSPGRLRRP
jgi:hypothetical protein